MYFMKIITYKLDLNSKIMVFSDTENTSKLV